MKRAHKFYAQQPHVVGNVLSIWLAIKSFYDLTLQIKFSKGDNRNTMPKESSI